MVTTSLRGRFVYKLAGNIAALALGVITMTLVTRALGPADYGRFEFITANFKLILDTLALQLPVAYFNWISRKGHKEDTDYASALTLYFSLFIILLLAVFIGVSIYWSFNYSLWPDVRPAYLWLALLLTAVTFTYQLLLFLADGRALTVGMEKIRLLQNVAKTLAVLFLFGWGVLSLSAYFAVQAILIVMSVLASAIWLHSSGACTLRALRPWLASNDERRAFHQHAVAFARPLVLSMVAGFVALYFDRWFLQAVGGAAQQGYFSLSDRMGILAFIVTTAMTPLLTREFAHAHEEGNHERLVELFEHIKKFLFIAVVIGCFMSTQSEGIVKLVGGAAYLGAVLPLAIMAMFPIHQTFGQLSAALMIATGQTRLYAKLAIYVLMFSPVVSYFLLAPSGWWVPGLALGATGLAVKLLVVQLIGTNIQLYFNTRFLGTSFLEWVLFQIEVIATVYLLSLASSLAAKLIIPGAALVWHESGLASSLVSSLLNMGVAGLIYLFLVALALMIRPGMAGVRRGDLRQIFRGRL